MSNRKSEENDQTTVRQVYTAKQRCWGWFYGLKKEKKKVKKDIKKIPMTVGCLHHHSSDTDIINRATKNKASNSAKKYQQKYQRELYKLPSAKSYDDIIIELQHE